MTPNFRETNEALYNTLSYFKIGRIGWHIRKMAGVLNLDYLDSYYEVTLQSHKYMENEINQNAIGSIHFIQLSLFEYLRDWLNNWQFNPGFDSGFENLIDQENIKEIDRYNLEIEKDKETYQATIPPGIAEGQEYEVEVKAFYDLFIQQHRPARIEKRINKFTTNKKPDLIDKRYLPDYISMVSSIIQSFRNHSEKYVVNFFAGKYAGNVSGLPSPQVKQLDAPIIQSAPTKVKANITVKQLLYFFKAMIETNIISHPNEIKDLHEIISNSFYTGKAEEISVDQLQKKWSEIQEDPKLAAFWVDKFIDLHNQAKKDNPNNIKF